MLRSSVIIAVLTLIPWVLCSSPSDCFHDDIESCRQLVEPGSKCRCPCLPKCCPEGQVLEIGLSSDPDITHGLRCVAAPLDAPSFPKIHLAGFLKSNISKENLRFYHSEFPLCKGIADPAWEYDTHTYRNFELNADYIEEYVLHLRTKHNETRTMISNFNNHANRGDVVVGFTPLMYFCFDEKLVPGRPDRTESVAVTCPKVPLKGTIHKCCPPGETFKTASVDECEEKRSSNGTKLQWKLPVNGHLYTEEELHANGNLVYRKNQSFLINATRDRCVASKKKVHDEERTFHVGPDALLHFTNTHNKMPPLRDYCVDMFYEDPDEEEILEDTYDDDFGSGNYLYDEDSSYYDDDYSEDTSDDYAEQLARLTQMDEYNCHEDTLKPHTMYAYYCYEPTVQVRKCCDKNQTLNLRARSCMPDMDDLWQNLPVIHDLNSTASSPIASSVRHINLLPLNLPNMNLNHLYVSNGDYMLYENETLQFEGNFYEPSKYCLDYSINYCDGLREPNIRAIIDDPDLEQIVASTIFGTNKEDSTTSMLLKRIGYPISIFCLMLTFVVFLILPELRKDLHGKMVINIVGSQILTYLSLFLGTFSSASVSKMNNACVAQGIITYTCILLSFAWMTTMSYNIMSKFRGSTYLPKDADQLRFKRYCAFCYGFSLFMCILVTVMDRAVDTKMAFIRPGFGEESCWFTSCSSGLTYFLYCPISIMLLSNICMFVFAATKLLQMQGRVRDGKRRSGISDASGAEAKRRSYRAQRSIGSLSENSDLDEDTQQNIRRKFIRQVSTVSQKFSLKNKQNYAALKENFSTYLKLFVAMGLTWILEVIAHFMSSEDSPPPEAIIIVFNVLNIFQGLIVCWVFTFKPSTSEKLKARLGMKRHCSSSMAKSGAFSPGQESKLSYDLKRESGNNEVIATQATPSSQSHTQVHGLCFDSRSNTTNTSISMNTAGDIDHRPILKQTENVSSMPGASAMVAAAPLMTVSLDDE